MTEPHLPVTLNSDDPHFLEAVKGAIKDGASRITVEEDAETVAREIAARTLDAKNLDELRTGSQAVSAGDLVAHELTIRSVRWANSDTESGPGVYAVCDCRDETDRRDRVVFVGAQQQLAYVIKLLEFGALPCRVRVTTVGKAKPGQSAPLGFDILPTEEPF